MKKVCIALLTVSLLSGCASLRSPYEQGYIACTKQQQHDIATWPRPMPQPIPPEIQAEIDKELELCEPYFGHTETDPKTGKRHFVAPQDQGPNSHNLDLAY